MSGIYLTLKDKITGKQWEECLDSAPISVVDMDTAEIWAKGLIRNFNDTLCPGEHPRQLLEVAIEVDDDGNMIIEREHQWGKSNLVTIAGKYGGSYDTMRCEICGITGKRFGLSDYVTVDKKYKSEKYKFCI